MTWWWVNLWGSTLNTRWWKQFLQDQSWNMMCQYAFLILVYVGQYSNQEPSEDRLINGQLFCKASWQKFSILPPHSSEQLASFLDLSDCRILTGGLATSLNSHTRTATQKPGPTHGWLKDAKIDNYIYVLMNQYWVCFKYIEFTLLKLFLSLRFIISCRTLSWHFVHDVPLL